MQALDLDGPVLDEPTAPDSGEVRLLVAAPNKPGCQRAEKFWRKAGIQLALAQRGRSAASEAEIEAEVAAGNIGREIVSSNGAEAEGLSVAYIPGMTHPPARNGCECRCRAPRPSAGAPGEPHSAPLAPAITLWTT
jgi:hypothetical protein